MSKASEWGVYRISFSELQRRDLPRLIEAVGYQAAMRRAHVPEKNIRRILRRWTSAWLYCYHKETKALIADIRRGSESSWV